MKRWNVVVEIPAQHDIAQAHSWIAECDAEAAARWFDSIYETIGSLEIFPERCPLARESRFFNQEIRQILHGRRQYKYRILFTVTGDEVHVLHVRHGARLAIGQSELAEE